MWSSRVACLFLRLLLAGVTVRICLDNLSRSESDHFYVFSRRALKAALPPRELGEGTVSRVRLHRVSLPIISTGFSLRATARGALHHRGGGGVGALGSLCGCCWWDRGTLQSPWPPHGPASRISVPPVSERLCHQQIEWHGDPERAQLPRRSQSAHTSAAASASLLQTPYFSPPPAGLSGRCRTRSGASAGAADT